GGRPRLVHRPRLRLSAARPRPRHRARGRGPPPPARAPRGPRTAGPLPLLGGAPQGRTPHLPRELPGSRRLHPRRRRRASVSLSYGAPTPAGRHGTPAITAIRDMPTPTRITGHIRTRKFDDGLHADRNSIITSTRL